MTKSPGKPTLSCKIQLTRGALTRVLNSRLLACHSVLDCVIGKVWATQAVENRVVSEQGQETEFTDWPSRGGLDHDGGNMEIPHWFIEP